MHVSSLPSFLLPTFSEVSSRKLTGQTNDRDYADFTRLQNHVTREATT